MEKINKAVENYSDTTNNYVIENELTVEITLNEYRELVKKVATKESDIDKANADKYEREKKIMSLQSENDALKAENYELKKRIDELSKGFSPVIDNVKEIG